MTRATDACADRVCPSWSTANVTRVRQPRSAGSTGFDLTRPLDPGQALELLANHIAEQRRAERGIDVLEVAAAALPCVGSRAVSRDPVLLR